MDKSESAESAHGANYYRTKLRSLLHSRLSDPPAIPCTYCQSEPHEWCECDCGSPFPILHPDYRGVSDE